MKAFSIAALALICSAPMALAETSKSCKPGTATCKATKTAATAKPRPAPADAVTAPRRQGQKDDFYSFGLKG